MICRTFFEKLFTVASYNPLRVFGLGLVMDSDTNLKVIVAKTFSGVPTRFNNFHKLLFNRV